MCTYLTEHVFLEGSGKFATGWAAVDKATVYFDHPVHAMADHSLNIDFFAADGGELRRLALELTPQSALELAAAIHRTLASAPPELIAGAPPELIAGAPPELIAGAVPAQA
jgi:hypothetical protein